MDDNLRKMVEENNKLLLQNLEITRENQKKIKKIHSHIRRTMFAKVLYWVIIIIVTVSAIYYSKPYIKEAVSTYEDVREQLDTTSGIINNPGAYLKDVNLIERIFGSS